MNQKRYTNEDIEKAHNLGLKKGKSFIIKDIIELSREFIHPKLINSFKVKLEKAQQQKGDVE